jgi:hypothetical protein
MLIADTNEFHPLVDAVAYRDSREADGTNHPIIIMRVSYSITHIDLAYARNVRAARAAGLLIGHYGYMVAGADAAAQGKFFAHIVATTAGFKPGDTIWCDDEEGLDNQTDRAVQWLVAARGVLHDHGQDEGVYSGSNFWVAHLGSLPSGLNRWVAAYSPVDPKLAGEDLWQFTDARDVPGVSGPCDASIYKGTVDDWLKMIGASTSSSGTFLEDSTMQQLAPGTRLPFVWPDGAKTLRFSTDAPAGKEIPVHIAWYTQDPNWHDKVVVGNVTEPKIPGGRGCIIHRDDTPDSESGAYQLSVVAST